MVDMAKKKMIISMENASKEVLEAIQKKYPNGWQDFVIKVEKGPDSFFHAITVDTDEASYLIKVNVKVDTKIEEEIEKDDYGFLNDEHDSGDFAEDEEESTDKFKDDEDADK